MALCDQIPLYQDFSSLSHFVFVLLTISLDFESVSQIKEIGHFN